jgi:hypothetical protein
MSCRVGLNHVESDTNPTRQPDLPALATSPYCVSLVFFLSISKNDVAIKRCLLGVLLLVFSQSYVEYDLRKNKIVVSFFCQQINFL